MKITFPTKATNAFYSNQTKLKAKTSAMISCHFIFLKRSLHFIHIHISNQTQPYNMNYTERTKINFNLWSCHSIKLFSIRSKYCLATRYRNRSVEYSLTSIRNISVPTHNKSIYFSGILTLYIRHTKWVQQSSFNL